MAARLGKPLVLAEFGKKAGKDGDRADFFQKVMRVSATGMRTEFIQVSEVPSNEVLARQT